MDREARPKIQSMGNSLTSVSSLTTLPPSPLPRRTRSAHVGAVSGQKPTETHIDPLGLNVSEQVDERERPLSPPGSVPSPKPRFAHLNASAPARPRLPRPMSSPSFKSPRIPSPLNPASQHLKPTPPPPFNPVDGSVPNPKPNRLFTSLFYHPASPPTTTEPILPKDQEATNRRPPRLENGQKGSAPRKISPSGFNTYPVPVPLSQAISENKETALPDDDVSNGIAEKAPNSFSTFVASIESLRRESLLASPGQGTLETLDAPNEEDSEAFDQKRSRYSRHTYAHD